MGSNQQPLDYKPNAFLTELGGLICIVEFKLLLLYVTFTVLYIATTLYVASLHNHAIVALGMYHIVL